MEDKGWMEREGEQDLTGDEMIEFLDEYCEGLSIFKDDCVLTMNWLNSVTARTVREAINKAAAIFKEINS